MPKFICLPRSRGAIPLFFSCLIALTMSTRANPPKDPFVAAGADDASLNAVCAPTPDRAWAVGDRGVIWGTADGGRKWVRQDSGTTANLHAVYFKNSTEGCAVGGLPGPMSRTSRGVIVRTVNGGETWSVLPSEGLPRFTGMRAIGGRLIAWGDYCPQRKTGIFYSVDDGQTWRAMESSIAHVAALGVEPSGNMIAIDRVGNAFNAQMGPMRSFFTTSPHQPIAFVEHVGSTWLAGGADGQLIRTIDAQSWTRVALPLSPAAQQVCQWRTMAQFEDQIWIAGTPGSIVLHSADRGVSWDIQSTEQTLPLRSIVFTDAQRGWAVGPLGLIMATRDGGRTWYSQRKTATRVGLMSVTSSETQIPWPVLVASSWDEVVASKSISLFAENLEQSANYLVETWKLNEALAPQLGVVEHESWLHPKPTETSQGDLSQLADRLAVELQCWRPDVLLTDETGKRHSLANRAAMAALNAAIQQASLANQKSLSKELMLPAWKVTKLATVTEARSSQYSEHPNRLMREPGLSIWDVLAPLGMTYDSDSTALSMRTIQQAHSTLASNTSLFGGIAPSQTSRRQVSLRNLGNYQLIMGRVHRMISLDQLVALPIETPFAEWQTQLDFVLRSLPPRELSPALLRVVNACSVPSLWQRRQHALERLVQVHPDSDTASHARLMMLQMLSSDEMRVWSLNAAKDQSAAKELGNGQSVGSLRNDPSNSFSRSASSLTPFDTVSASATQQESAKGLSNAKVVTGESLISASKVDVATFVASSNVGSSASSKAVNPNAQQIDSFFRAIDNCYKSDLYLANLPQTELMREAMSRARLGATYGGDNPSALLETIANLSAIAGWPQVARQELLLAKDRPEQLRWVGFAVATANRPLLDGVLDEPMWAACPSMKLTVANKNSKGTQEMPATVRWSFDDRYLYIAIDSPRDDRANMNRAPKLRKYDSDLAGVDHIHFVLDTDRDYASAIELGVSAEGETFDRCCGMPQYNPQYAVAVPTSPLPDRWVAEIAIPISNLTTKADLTGEAWAISAHRRSRKAESENWSSMLSEQPSLQSAGILLFVQPPEKSAK